MRTGRFAPPSPVDITVTGGDASEFKLADTSPRYSRFAWSGVRLMSPGAFSDVHVLRLDIDGRLATNGIEESGYAAFAIDGKTLKANSPKP